MNKFLLVILLSIGLSNLQAQETTTTTGSEATGTGGTVSYTVGQVVYTTNVGTSGSVAQGVQQPFEISVVNGIEEVGINLQMVAYPNPTVDFLRLSIEDGAKFLNTLNHGFAYYLYDIKGNLLQNEKIISEQTQINMSNYVPSTYFVRIIADSKSIKEFKIIKK